MLRWMLSSEQPTKMGVLLMVLGEAEGVVETD